MLVRDGSFDVVVVAGPRVTSWPSPGVRAISSFCAEMGLKVGVFGGETLSVKGVIPLPGTGGLVLAEDAQRRIHRIRARAVVRVSAPLHLPDPFPGWRSQGLIPIDTAELLFNESRLAWDPGVVLLGTGNRALRFGSALLESGVGEAICVESFAQWGAKRFAGWEVERRRFEMLGGRIIEARPVSLVQKASLLWDFRLKDEQGIRVLETARVVAAGPFGILPEVREHPSGSFLFELERTSGQTRGENVEGWVLEEERGRLLACKIVKALVTELGERREELERMFRRAKGRLKRYVGHRERPFTPAYQGKFTAHTDMRTIRSFGGVPKKGHSSRMVASVECFEEIPCDSCVRVCPEGAIELGRVTHSRQPILDESKCTACGLCLVACPSRSILLIQEPEERSMSRLTLPWSGPRQWAASEVASLVNRRGDLLGSARVMGFLELPPRKNVVPTSLQLVQVEVPSHLVWEARGLRRTRGLATTDNTYLESEKRGFDETERVEIVLDGEKRLARDRISATVALFEMGQGRAQDVLLCRDGSCGLCHVSVDGVSRDACRTQVHRGMGMRLVESRVAEPVSGELLCSCMGITREEVIERLSQGKLHSPEAVLAVTHVGEGRCHGQLCMGAFRRLLVEQGVDVAQWIDWRFPWSDWVLGNH